MAVNDPNPYPGQFPPKKKISPWFWLAVGFGALLAILLMMTVAGGLFVWYKVRQAGLDPEMMRRNPAMAVATIVASTNPNVEVLGVDEKKGVIRVREKSSGKIMTVNLEDARQGRFVFQEEGEVKVGSGQDAMTFRQGAGKTPDWAPAYPGASVEGNVSMQGGEGESGGFHLITKDPADKVIAFYETALKNAGLKVTGNSMREGGAVSGGMVMGEDQEKKRNIMVTIGPGDQGTAVNVVFSTKN